MRAEPETRGLSSFYLRCGRALKEPQRLGGAVHIAMRAQLLLVAHTLLACLVAVHASGNAFSWLATEHAESEINLPQHTSRLRETPNAFIPIQIDNICLPSAALKSRPGTAISFSLILLWIVSVTGVYLLGWHCGLSQAKARHVLQQATAADHQDEQAKAASTAEESAASQAVALTTLDHSGDSQHASHLLADSSSLSSVESASSGVQQDIDVAAAGLFHDAQPGSSNSCADALDQALGNSALAQVPLLQSAGVCCQYLTTSCSAMQRGGSIMTSVLPVYLCSLQYQADNSGLFVCTCDAAHTCTRLRCILGPGCSSPNRRRSGSTGPRAPGKSCRGAPPAR